MDRQSPADETGTLFARSLGQVNDIGGECCLVVKAGEAGHLLYGARQLRPAGRYAVEFQVALAGDEAIAGDPICVTLDVVTNEGKTALAVRHLPLSQIDRELQPFVLEIVLLEPRELEYRVYGSGDVGLVVSGAPKVTALPSDPSLLCPSEANSVERVWENESEFLDGYLRNVSGIIHVGANLGQEREYYRLFGLDVVWVEPIREIYDRLVDNIAGFARQRAYKALLTDREGIDYEFNIADNNGASSSILAFDKHTELWPEVHYSETRTLTSTTLEALMNREGISARYFQALTMDVEGAELLVLKGAGKWLREFRYVKAEVADFTPRVGSPLTGELEAFMKEAGFKQLIRRPFGRGPNGQGTYWDIVWKRTDVDEPLHRPGVSLPMIASNQDVSGMDKVHG